MTGNLDTTQEWKPQLYSDYARLRKLADELRAAASSHDLTPGELHSMLDRIDVIRAEWDHAPVAARRAWALLEAPHRVPMEVRREMRDRRSA
ncbi:hypothetical protein [Nocardia sp. NPDC003963]